MEEEALRADGILKLLGLRVGLAGSKMLCCSEYMGWWGQVLYTGLFKQILGEGEMGESEGA